MSALVERKKASLAAWGALGLSLALGGCAQELARLGGKEYFPESKYGKASARVVTSGSVPKGGGQYLVGRPYHVAGRTYVPVENDKYAATGMASWYGDAFHGRRTANGEIYDKDAVSAAHPTMPLPCYARVTNLANGHSIIVRVNDRGPFAAGRVMDVSSRVADLLEFKGAGTAHVHIEYYSKAPLEGSDDRQLAASLRTDGKLATLEGTPESTMVADAVPDAAPAPAFAAPPPAPAPAPAIVTAAADPQDDEPQPKLTPVKSPLPPERPFDLGPVSTIGAPLPPSRPANQRSGALYFAEPPAAPDAFLRLRLKSALPFAAD